MKSRYLMAGLLIIGILGASGSTAAAAIDNTISGANIEIAQIAEINNIQPIDIGNIADLDAIDGAIGPKAVNGILIENSNIADRSLIAIANVIDQNIHIHLIETKITEIAA